MSRLQYTFDVETTCTACDGSGKYTIWPVVPDEVVHRIELNAALDRRTASRRFTEIVAKTLDIYDQQREGVCYDTPFDHERWRERYNGTPWHKLPPHTITINHFKPVVDMTVAQLMLALDDDEWEKANKPIPGLQREPDGG